MTRIAAKKTTLKDRLLKITKEVQNCPTAPYREEPVREYIKRFCDDRKIDYRQDDMGNIIVTYGKQYDNEVLAFAAHMDHPGFIAEQDSAGKKVTALFYGGVEEKYFKGSKVRFFTANGEVRATVRKTRFDQKKRTKRAWLDVEGDVNRGDAGMWDLKVHKVKAGNIYSRVCDDLAGCAAVLALLDELKLRRIRKKVMGVFTVAEESGLNGAKYLCANKRISKKINIVAIETSSELCNAKIGDGVVIRVGDATSIFTPEMTDFMTKIAKGITSKGFNFQRRLMDGGTCESSVYQSFGYCNGAVCVPLGNYHNRNVAGKKIEEEYVSVKDMVNMALLFVDMVKHCNKLVNIKKAKRPVYKQLHGQLGEVTYR